MATAPEAQQRPLKFTHPDDMPDRYALTGTGTCMEPILPDGSILAFTKSEEPQPGDIVGLIFTPEAAQPRQMPGMVKRLVMPLPPKGFDGFVVVEQINPPRRLVFSTADLLAVHKFIGIPERGKDGILRLRLPAREA